jgi:ABC-type Fe3+/spermidine/putrescine transport system ATPase subunit
MVAVTSTEASSLRVRDVRKSFPTPENPLARRLALDAVSVSLAAGELVSLVGPSGCGKSTLLRLIAGLDSPDSGELLIGSEPITGPNAERGLVFQDPNLFPWLTVRRNIQAGLVARGVLHEKRDEVDEFMRLVALDGFANAYPHHLSGGMAQRVALARALINHPRVLLLDEPLGALDLKLRQRLQVELSQIHREVGTTFVYVTHDQEEAMSMADRIAVMNLGVIEQLGTPFEIYRRPTSRFVADFIGDANFVDATIDGDVATLSDGTRVGSAGSAVNGPATLMVRPESLRVGDVDRAPAGCVRGRTLQSSFLGTRIRVAVEAACSPVPLIVALHGEDPETVPAEDTEVAVWWQPDDAIVLPRAVQ